MLIFKTRPEDALVSESKERKTNEYRLVETNFTFEHSRFDIELPSPGSRVRVGFDPIPSHRRRPREARRGEGGGSVGTILRFARRVPSRLRRGWFITQWPRPRCGGPVRNQFRETAAEQDHRLEERSIGDRGQRWIILPQPRLTEPLRRRPAETKKEKGASELSISREGVCVCVDILVI